MIGNVHEQVAILQRDAVTICSEGVAERRERMTSASNPIRRLRNLTNVIRERKVPCDHMNVCGT